MKWTHQHDVLFCREVIAFQLFTHKPSSRERGQCHDRIVESLNAINDVYFKKGQRAIRDRIKNLRKFYVSKRNREKKASGIELEHSELDDLMLNIYDQHKQIENETSEASEKVKIAKDQDKIAAEEIRACAVERLSKTRKRNLNKADHGQGRIQRFWPTKKILGFRWSKKAKITLETKAFGKTFLLVFSNFLHFYI